MRRILFLAVVVALAGAAPASADDPHAEMALALAAQVDLHPQPVRLPVVSAAPRHAASQSPVRSGAERRAIAEQSARAAAQAQQGSAQALAQAQALARQAQAAAAAAAGQAQAQAAKQRASHPHPTPHR